MGFLVFAFNLNKKRKIDQYFYFNNNINTITKGNMWTICAFDNYIALS